MQNELILKEKAVLSTYLSRYDVGRNVGTSENNTDYIC